MSNAAQLVRRDADRLGSVGRLMGVDRIHPGGRPEKFPRTFTAPAYYTHLPTTLDLLIISLQQAVVALTC